MKTYNLVFNGYYLETKIGNILNSPGVYFVYTCEFNADVNTVTLKKLIYIGQSEKVGDRLRNHEKKNLFDRQCKSGEDICYSIAFIKKEDLDIVENALIYVQKPPLNDQLVDEYNYEDASFKLDGQCTLFTMTNFSITTR